MSVARYIVAGLGASASVSAFPASSSWASEPASTLAPSSFSVPSISQPATPSPPANSNAAAASAAALVALAEEAQDRTTNVNRFHTLLTVNGDGKQLLPPDQLRDRTVFDFSDKANPLGQGGRFVLANENNFPILVEQGISTAVAFLNPCGLDSPHTHPRATEWLTVVQGNVQSGFMLENGFLANPATGALTTQVTTDLGPFQGTIFPQGSIHFQFNDNCEPATFIATLNSEDPGTSQVAQNFFFLDDKVVNVTLGEPQNIDGQNIDQFRNTLPPNLVLAVDSCLKRCEAKDGGKKDW